MAVNLVVGPCGAGKSTYIKKHAKQEDWVIEWDDIHKLLGGTPKQTSAARKGMEAAAKNYEGGDVWISRSKDMGDPEKRTAKAKEIGADQVIVIKTSAETAKKRIEERDLPKERKDSQLASVDEWWSEYGVVPSDLIVQPSGDPNPSDKDEPKMPKETNRGFPDDTPVADMEIEEQAAYWKHKSRKHETNAKNALSELEEYKTAHPEGSNQEIDEAKAEELRNEGRQAALAELLPDKVKAAFSAKVGSRLEADKLAELLEDLNLNNFVKDGDVDLEKVEARANILAPQAPTRRTRQTHQGPRQQDDTSKSSTLAGAELFESLHGKKV